MVLIALINVYPMFSGLIYSFQDRTMARAGDFVGLGNFAQLLRMEDFWNALEYSAVFSIFSVIGSYVFGLALAVMLNKEVLVFLRSEDSMTIPVGLQLFMQQYAADWGSLTAASTLALLPVFIFFLFVQKYMIYGSVAGSVKG